MLDCLIIGGGIIGLSAAYEIAKDNKRVQVIDRRRSDRTASWAAAGILPPPIGRATHDGMEQLRALSHRLYPEWCRELEQQSGLAVGYRRCGGIYLARKAGETAALGAALDQWSTDGVDVEAIDEGSLRKREPALENLDAVQRAYYLKDEAQVRPPRLLSALRSCLREHDVPVTRDVEITGWQRDGTRIRRVQTTSGAIEASEFCVATGPWSQETFAELDIDVPVEPLRGQMLMWQCDRPLIQHVVNEGPRYLLSRDDGRLLAGSTIEDVGFDDGTTCEAFEELREFASGLIPSLRACRPTAHWAGLRPGSRDGFPYVGRVPHLENLIAATGHFRSGIHLAPATAQVIRQLVSHVEPEADLAAFAPTRT